MTTLQRHPLLTIGAVFLGIGPLLGAIASWMFVALFYGMGTSVDWWIRTLVYAYVAGALPAVLVAGLAYGLYRRRGALPLASLLIAGVVLSAFDLWLVMFLIPKIEFDVWRAVPGAFGHLLTMHLTAVFGCWGVLKFLDRPREWLGIAGAEG